MNVYWEGFARARERDVRASAGSPSVTDEYHRPSRLVGLRRIMGRGIIGVGLMILGEKAGSRQLDRAA